MAVLIRIALVLVLLGLSGCSPMPGPALFDGMVKPTKIDEIADFKEIPQSFWMTNISCYKIGFKRRPISATLSALMLAPILGCCDITKRDGKIVKCHAYYPTGDEYVREHELKHCEGYKDNWF